MGWIAISDGRRPVLTPNCASDATAGLLPSGSLVLEVQYSAEDGARQTVVSLERHLNWFRRFKVTLGAKGGMFVEHRQGDTNSSAALKFPRPDRDAMLRITISWHAPERIGLMSVENLDSGELNQSVLEEPHPWPLDDIAALISRDEGCHVDPTATLLAFSDKVEPVGLNAGFGAGTLIDTLAGLRRVEDLRPGDVVQTSEHGMQPIRCVVCREVPALGRFMPVRLRAPFFGLQRDLTVAPDHRLLISGVDAEYLFGSDSVLVEARHLAMMSAHRRGPRPTTIRYVQVLLDAHVCLSAGGAWGESLFIGDLPEHPVRHATSLLAEHLPGELPRHTRFASPELKSYEAMVLVSAMCA